MNPLAYRTMTHVFLVILTLTALNAQPLQAQPSGEAGKASVEISEDGAAVAEPTPAAPADATTDTLELTPEPARRATTGTVRMLKTLEAFHKDVKAVHASFDQLRVDETFEDKVKSKGQLWFSKPDRFRCDYADPEPMMTLIVDMSLWMYFPELEQVDLWTFETPQQRDQQLHQILIAFGFEADLLLKEYEIHCSEDEPQPREMLKKEKMKPEEIVLFTIKPRPDYAETSAFLESRIYIDRAKLLPVKIWYRDQSDSTMSLTMKKIDLDAIIDDKVYDVKALIPPDTDIIDKRSMR